MTGQSSGIPLAEILQAANELVQNGLIEDYALGGALAAIYYVEPFVTYDADIFFIPKQQGLTAELPEIYAFLQARGWQTEGDHLLLNNFPVQFLAGHGLTEEAIREAESVEYSGIRGKLFSAEHVIAVAASVGRQKDKARIEQMLKQADPDRIRLDKILKAHKLRLPD